MLEQEFNCSFIEFLRLSIIKEKALFNTLNNIKR